jgi:hypothetical protein
MASSTLIGTAPDQVPTNGDLGDLAFQNSDSVNFRDGSGGLGHLDITKINQLINVTAVDICVYDTSKDSDNGKWRFRSQHTSWYNEELNTTIRGSRRDFPSIAVIVATSSQIIIYDGDDPTLPMWMIINTEYSGHSWSGAGLLPGDANINGVAAINGNLVVAQKGDAKSLVWIKFVSDESFAIPAQYWGWCRYNGSIADRSDKLGYRVTISSGSLTSGMANDVAITVLPNAPIDPATGLPSPTIALATDGGVTVVTHNNTISNQTLSAQNTSSYDGGIFVSVDFDSGGALWATQSHRSSAFGANLKYIPAPYTNATTITGWTGYVQFPTVFGYGFGGGAERIKFARTERNNTISLASDFPARGLSKIAINPSDFSRSMVANIRKDHNTGWMVGDMKGAWLSDTQQITLAGVELVNNGNFDSNTSGWTAVANLSLSVSSGQLLLTKSGIAGVLWAYQVVNTEVGKVYTVKATLKKGTGQNCFLYIGTAVSENNLGWTSTTSSSDTFVSVTFTASTTTTVINVGGHDGADGTTSFVDSVSMRLADVDRTNKGKGLQIFGNVTKRPVSTNSELVGYGNFSSSNYLVQPYNSDLDFGTGDFSYSFWINENAMSADSFILIRGDYGQDNSITFMAQNSSGDGYTLQAMVRGANGATIAYPEVETLKWTHIVLCRDQGTLMGYKNGVLISRFACTQNLSLNASTYKELWIGNGLQNGSVWPYALQGQLALLRISGTAPSAAQVRRMYEDEKYLFQENSKVALYGASDAVQGLAYDEENQLLHVGTSSGRSVFDGLRRTENTTTAVSSSISAANGLIAEN